MHSIPDRCLPRTCFLAAASVIGFGLLCASCQPLVSPNSLRSGDDAHSQQTLRDAQGKRAGSPAVPEIEWSEPPLCKSQMQHDESICARLRYRAGGELRELVWSAEGIEHNAQSLPDAPSGITSYSPDRTKFVVQTPRGHTAGGPLYLYDLESDQLRNLKEEIGLPVYTSLSELRVAGWHPDGEQLLLVDEDAEVAVWGDLERKSYQALDLGIDTGQIAPPRRIRLASDGSGFTFISRSHDSKTSDLYWYDLSTGQTRLLLSLPLTEGRLLSTTVSPDGSQLALVLSRGGRALGRSHELRLLNRIAADGDPDQSRLLFSGNFGPAPPKWSPDGEHIALIRAGKSGPLRAGHDQPVPLGDIWTVAVKSGEAIRLTFTEAIARSPLWSPDGTYLAFITIDGQLGMVEKAAPGKIWRLDVVPNRPQLAGVQFVSQE